MFGGTTIMLKGSDLDNVNLIEIHANKLERKLTGECKCSCEACDDKCQKCECSCGCNV